MNKKITIMTGLMLAVLVSCKMENPLLIESTLPYGAPQFDKIRTEHYLPAFEQTIAEGKADIDAIVSNPEEPDFKNTIEALEYAGEKFEKVAGIFYNLMEADTNDEMQEIAEKISPEITEYGLYVSLNEGLFARVKAVYDKRESLGLERDQMRLLEKTYLSFVRSGALLSGADKDRYGELSEKISLLQLQFSKNALDATNAYTLNITEEKDLKGLPQYVREMAAENAREKGQEGWTFDLSAPSYSAFMKFSDNRDLRQKMSTAYGSRAYLGEFDNSETCRQIANLRLEIANILGYKTYADYVIEDHMLKEVSNVTGFLDELMEPTLPAARSEVAGILDFAKENGFEDDSLQPWDFSYWAEKYRDAKYSLNDEQLKPYFRLENCIDAVFGLATTLYGISFKERTDLPKYHPDVKIYDVKDADGSHLALFYCDFFPRASKRGGAWMTTFRTNSIRDGKEIRPIVSLVCNFTKPTVSSPSLITHDEFVTFLHEFGHSLHGILSEARYPSISCTSVDHDFVELPSQIMENWAYEPEFLKKFACHYETGQIIPDELITKIVETQNYNAAYYQLRQLQFGLIDMGWYNISEPVGESPLDVENKAKDGVEVLPVNPATCTSTAFSHIFAGGYSAGYYSYKWAEVLAADAFSLFKEKGIFNTEVSGAFRREILSRGSSEDESMMYRNFRGHDPQPRALLVKLGIIKR